MSISFVSRTSLAIVLAIASSPSSLPAQTSQQSDLHDRLNASYHLTKSGFADASRVTDPGTVYVIQVDGLFARSSTDHITPTATIEDGRVLPVGRGFRGAIAVGGNTMQVKPGERFYVHAIDIKDDSLVFHLLSLDTHVVVGQDHSVRDRSRMAIKFPIPKGSAERMTLADVQRLTNPIFSPEAPVGEPRQVKLGESRADLERDLGHPDTEVDLGQKKILVYKKLKITVIDDKVTDVA